MVLTFTSHSFSIYYPIFTVYAPPKSSKMSWRQDIKMSQYNEVKDTCPRLKAAF